jgi:hypothetical protein
VQQFSRLLSASDFCRLPTFYDQQAKSFADYRVTSDKTRDKAPNLSI